MTTTQQLIKNMNVLVACEESQRVCEAFRNLGHNAFSCDIVECSGGHPEWHFKEDVLKVIPNRGGHLESGDEYYLPEGEEWDLMVAHPPCTYLSVSGAQWYYHPEDKDLPKEKRRPHPLYPTRAQDREDAVEFFMKFYNSDVKRIAIENPVGIMSTRFRKPDQIIEPWMFGDEASKKTCLWLKNLPKLNPTNIVGKGEVVVGKNGWKMQKWFSDAFGLPKAERQKIRSKTFPGIAKAIAEQWGKLE